MDLRAATEADISFIVEIEHSPEFHEYIAKWTVEEHQAALRDPNTGYLIALDSSGSQIGYVILRGLESEHRTIELIRVAMRLPGQGSGKHVLRLVLKKVFEELGAHRLWLDVLESNLRAQHVYLSLGFQQDGMIREGFFSDGKYHSLILMSLLDREYRAIYDR
jgi:diamine N-acetyltransferase